MPHGPGFGAVVLKMTLIVGLGVLAGCSRPLPVPGGSCTDARDCDVGETCSAGVCIAGGVTSCITDLDCSADGTQLCNAGICVANEGDGPGDGSCTSTTECAIDTFCNTATGLCSPLLDNWCRVDDQCREGSPVCSNRETGSGSPGRCLQCLSTADCDAPATCNAAGVCVSDAACPANAVAVGDGTCRCDIGFISDGAGGCKTPSSSSEGEGEGEAPVGGEGEGEGELPVGGEGEGEGPSTDFGGSCSNDFQCWDASGNSNTMCDAGECACDEAYLFWFVCVDYDPITCTCNGSSTPEDEGCGDITYEGECQGDTAVWCEFGEVYEEECNDGCGYTGEDFGFYCF